MIKRVYRKIISIFLVASAIIVVSYIMLKYDVEGEKNLPFSINQILIVSTVDGHGNEDNDNVWNIGVEQVNDIYIYIDKTVEDDQTIKEIKLENFNLTTSPQKGQVKLLRPTGELANLYLNSQEDFFNEGLTYLGGRIDDMKSLEISNDGGVLGFRLSITDLDNFISDDKEEISYDGRLLSDIGVTLEEIKFSVNFDIIITTSENINFKGTINLSLPLDDVIEKGKTDIKITDFENVVFKRV